MSTLFSLLFFVSLVFFIIGLIKPKFFSRFTKKEVNRKNLSIFFGLSMFVFIFFLGTFNFEDKNKISNNLPIQQQEEIDIYKNENIGKVVKLNSCLLDPENEDYWKSSTVNFWTSTKRDSVAFKLPACDNIELEIVDYVNENGDELFKVKNVNEEGWISKIQLIK